MEIKSTYLPSTSFPSFILYWPDFLDSHSFLHTFVYESIFLSYILTSTVLHVLIFQYKLCMCIYTLYIYHTVSLVTGFLLEYFKDTVMIRGVFTCEICQIVL